MRHVANGLRELAKSIDAGEVPESVCRIDYARDPSPREQELGIQGDGASTVTVVLRFDRWQEPLRLFVLSKLTGGT